MCKPSAFHRPLTAVEAVFRADAVSVWETGLGWRTVTPQRVSVFAFRGLCLEEHCPRGRCHPDSIRPRRAMPRTRAPEPPRAPASPLGHHVSGSGWSRGGGRVNLSLTVCFLPLGLRRCPDLRLLPSPSLLVVRCHLFPSWAMESPSRSSGPSPISYPGSRTP